MDMRQAIRFLITWTRIPHIHSVLLVVVLLGSQSASLSGQTPEPVRAIRELREGTLVIRFPAYKPKIDTLTAMSARAKDPKQKARIDKQLQQAIGERDTLFAQYTEAFRTKYHFSEVAYYFDYDGRDLNKANYYHLDGHRLAVADLSEKPLYYAFFDRTEENKMDALVIYNRFLQKVPRPFPNDFTRGGINVLFIGISDKKFPMWRVDRMNKRLFAYWETYKE